MRVSATALTLLLILAACGAHETGSELPGGDFARATVNNIEVQSGQRNPLQELGGRFAREVPSVVNFDFNSAVLSPGAQQILARQAQWIRQFPEVRFRVYGHTDLVGSAGYNYQLGLRRAEAVVAFLGRQGISRARLEALVSHGKTRPLIAVPGAEPVNRRTVTEVSGFVARHPTVLNGKYAEIVHRGYVTSAGAGTPVAAGPGGGAAAGAGTP